MNLKIQDGVGLRSRETDTMPNGQINVPHTGTKYPLPGFYNKFVSSVFPL